MTSEIKTISSLHFPVTWHKSGCVKLTGIMSPTRGVLFKGNPRLRGPISGEQQLNCHPRADKSIWCNTPLYLKQTVIHPDKGKFHVEETFFQEQTLFCLLTCHCSWLGVHAFIFEWNSGHTSSEPSLNCWQTVGSWFTQPTAPMDKPMIAKSRQTLQCQGA